MGIFFENTQIRFEEESATDSVVVCNNKIVSSNFYDPSILQFYVLGIGMGTKNVIPRSGCCTLWHTTVVAGSAILPFLKAQFVVNTMDSKNDTSKK